MFLSYIGILDELAKVPQKVVFFLKSGAQSKELYLYLTIYFCMQISNRLVTTAAEGTAALVEAAAVVRSYHTCPLVAFLAPILLAWISPSLFSFLKSFTRPFHCLMYSSKRSFRWATDTHTHTHTLMEMLFNITKWQCYIYLCKPQPEGLVWHLTIFW